MTFLSVFFNVALAGAAAASLEGRSIGVREALGISWKRVGRIAQWALLAAGVGFILEQLASRIPGAGRLASWLIGTAWSLATIFAAPLLALEGPGPVETAKQSFGLIKGKWGEGITGLGSRHCHSPPGRSLLSPSTATPTGHRARARSTRQTSRNRSAVAATATDPGAHPKDVPGSARRPASGLHPVALYPNRRIRVPPRSRTRAPRPGAQRRRRGAYACGRSRQHSPEVPR